MAPVEVDRGRIAAFRLAGSGLVAATGDPSDVLRGWTVQDSPPGAAVAALAGRAPSLPVGWLDDALWEDRSVVALYNARTATSILPADEVAAFGTALLPGDDDAALRPIVGPALPEVDEGYAEPVALGVAAIAAALDGRTLERDGLHRALRAALPGALLPWCEGCASHHVRRGVLVMASLHGMLCLAGREGRRPVFARTDQWTGWTAPAREVAGAGLVRRYLAAYGPSGVADFATWAGIAPGHARALWTRVSDELEEVVAEGRSAGSVLSRDVARLRSAVAPEGVLLVGPGDPLLLGRDRERLLPDAAARKRVFSALGGAGVVLRDGRIVATCRATKQRSVLRLALQAVDGERLPASAVVLPAAQRLAPHRGCRSADVVIA